MAEAATSPLVLGLTGSFGSGCSTLAEALERHQGFSRFHLSRSVRKVWKDEHVDEERTPTRAELQDIGNRERRDKGNQILAEMEAATIRAGDFDKPVVIDGIKNEAEVSYLRREFPNFFLIAVQAGQEDRWSRVRHQYDQLSLPYEDFERDDVRDQIEDLDHGDLPPENCTSCKLTVLRKVQGGQHAEKQVHGRADRCGAQGA